MLRFLALAGGAALVLSHLRCRLELPRLETGRLYRTTDTAALPVCQRCGRKVRRPLVVLRDDETDREVFVGPRCATILLRTGEDIPDRPPVVDEAPLEGVRPSCCDVSYDQWKTDIPIDYKTARDALWSRANADAERGKYWKPTHAMTLRAIGAHRKRRWKECLKSCDQRLWQGDPDRPAIIIEERGADEVAVLTSSPMAARRTSAGWSLIDEAGLTLSTHRTRDAALVAAQAAADLPF